MSSAIATMRLLSSDGNPAGKPARLEGEYLQVDLVQIASGLGARAIRATTAAEVRGRAD